MEWKDIRAHYERAFRAARRRGLTQAKVAEAGGLKGQNVISKLLQNETKGPQVETFVKAVQGLGIPVSTFFAQIEQPRMAADIQHALAFARSMPTDDESAWLELGRVISRAVARELRRTEKRKPATVLRATGKRR